MGLNFAAEDARVALGIVIVVCIGLIVLMLAGFLGGLYESYIKNKKDSE